jgi:tetratricopeptide (TPR) repeat protein
MPPAPPLSADARARLAPADAAQAAGDRTALLSALTPLLSATDAELAAEAAFRLARAFQATGATDQALASIAAGLQKAVGPRRARLYLLQAELLDASGNAAGAARSRERAVEAGAPVR